MAGSGRVQPSIAPPPGDHIQVRSQSLLEVCSNELDIITMKKTTSLAKGGRASSSIQMTSGKNQKLLFEQDHLRGSQSSV